MMSLVLYGIFREAGFPEFDEGTHIDGCAVSPHPAVVGLDRIW